MLSGQALVHVERRRPCTKKSALTTPAWPSVFGKPAVCVFCTLGGPMTFVTCSPSLVTLSFFFFCFAGPSQHSGPWTVFLDRPGAHLQEVLPFRIPLREAPRRLSTPRERAVLLEGRVGEADALGPVNSLGWSTGLKWSALLPSRCLCCPRMHQVVHTQVRRPVNDIL